MTIVHTLILVFFVSLAFWPTRLTLRIWLPFVLSLVWIVFNGCPLTHIDPSLDDQIFIRSSSVLCLEKFQKNVFLPSLLVC